MPSWSKLNTCEARQAGRVRAAPSVNCSMQSSASERLWEQCRPHAVRSVRRARLLVHLHADGRTRGHRTRHHRRHVASSRQEYSESCHRIDSVFDGSRKVPYDAFDRRGVTFFVENSSFVDRFRCRPPYGMTE
eukprot:scaffold14163_cov115-Isochrysis_galbana.AAC.12